MRLSGVLLAATALLVLTACGSGAGGDPGGARPASAGDFQGAARPTGPPVAPPAGCQGESVVDVVTAEELQRALDEAAPGQPIRLADGKYRGSFVATAQASVDQPIHLCGSRAAVLDG